MQLTGARKGHLHVLNHGAVLLRTRGSGVVALPQGQVVTDELHDECAILVRLLLHRITHNDNTTTTRVRGSGHIISCHIQHSCCRCCTNIERVELCDGVVERGLGKLAGTVLVVADLVVEH